MTQPRADASSSPGFEPPDLPRVGALVAGATAAHQRLRATVAPLTDEITRRPSLLPDWTVGHVLTHISRNADSHVRMLEGVLEGQALTQYPGGPDQRAADIETGARRSSDELIADVVTTSRRLEATWERMTDAAWAGHGLFGDDTPWPAPVILFHRWRETEVHHADLGVGYSPEDWPDDYVAIELARQLTVLPDRLDVADRRHFTAWLLGREARPPLAELLTDPTVFRRT